MIIRQELENFYNKILEDNREKLLQGGNIDKFLLSEKDDTRMSLALLIRIEQSISSAIINYINELKDIEPNLYYYPAQNFHITVMDILRGMPNRTIPDNVNNYIKCIKYCASEIKPFSIEFNGVTASDNAVLIRGYYENELEVFRTLLRQSLSNNNLILEERYKTSSAHITIARIRKKLNNPSQFIEHIVPFKMFGTITIKELELTFHNWYDSKKIIIHKFNL